MLIEYLCSFMQLSNHVASVECIKSYKTRASVKVQIKQQKEGNISETVDILGFLCTSLTEGCESEQ